MKPTRLAAAGLITTLLGSLVAAAPANAAPDTASATSTSSTSCTTDPATPKRQFRAMWISSVVNIDWPSKASQTSPDRVAAQQAEYRELLDLAERLNHNAVVVQVRPTADALWPSPYEPWSEYLTGTRGQDPGWDPLAFLVDESHKRNLEFHAWFNPYRVSMPAPAAPARTSTCSLPATRPGSTPTGPSPTRRPAWPAAGSTTTPESPRYASSCRPR